MLYKIKDKKAELLIETKLDKEKMIEHDLENWIENDPSILGEDLLIIGRQVLIPEVNDRIDLLALDTEGNVVIIELKKGKLNDPVDVQSLRYVSYVSRWEFNDLERQAKNYYSEKGNEDFNLNEAFENFCSQSGIDEPPDLNQDQRIIILGNKLKEKIGSVALWLREHQIDIKIIEVSLYKDGSNLLLIPLVIIPAPTTEKYEIGKQSHKSDRPWLIDGESWHLEKRCGKEIKKKLVNFNGLINENFESVEGPNWNQKFYLTFLENGHRWISIETRKSSLLIIFSIKKGSMSLNSIEKKLNIKAYNKKYSLSEKLNLESSIEIRNQDKFDMIRLRIKKEFNVNSKEFIDFISECYESFGKVKNN